MKFTVKQLFSLTDGRLSTNMGDVSDMLSVVVGRSLITHELPVVLNYIEEIKPDWFIKGKEQLEEIKQEVGNDFQTLMIYIDKMYSANYHEVLEMTKEQKEGFEKYNLDNRLI